MDGFWICILSATLFSGNCQRELISGNGTFFFNGIFSITGEENKINVQSGFLMAETMKFAIQKVNNESILGGHKFAIGQIFDSSTENEVKDNVLKTFLSQVPYLVGPYTAETSYVTSILSGTFHQVTLSYSAEYSHFDVANHKHNKMLRTVPSDAFRVQAVLDMVEKLGWKYLNVIGSYHHDGELTARDFVAKLHTIDTCLENKVELPKAPSVSVYTNALNEIKKENTSIGKTPVILFTSKKDTSKIFDVAKKLNLQTEFLFVCVYGCTTYVEIVSGKEEAFVGTLSLDLNPVVVPGLKKHLASLRPHRDSELYFIMAWEQIFNCSLFGSKTRERVCTGNESLWRVKDYFSLTPLHTVYNAIYSVANAIQVFMKAFCSLDDSISAELCKNHAANHDTIDKYYDFPVFNILRQSAYADGTLKSRLADGEIVAYNFYEFMKIDDSYTNVFRGVWRLDHKDLNARASDVLEKVTPDFHFNVTGITTFGECLGCAFGFAKVAVEGNCCGKCELNVTAGNKTVEDTTSSKSTVSKANFSFIIISLLYFSFGVN